MDEDERMHWSERFDFDEESEPMIYSGLPDDGERREDAEKID